MDEKKLEELRARFGEGTPDEMETPHFVEAYNTLFNAGSRRKPWEGVATFLDLPYLDAAPDSSEFSDLDLAVIGVPMDLGVTNRPGARFGPRALRSIERVGPYHHTHNLVPQGLLKSADVGDVPMKSRYSLESCHEDIFDYYDKVRDSGVIPLSVGGDHSITQSIMGALGRDEPMGMIHIDAHCDTAPPLEGSKFQHGGPFRQAVLDGVLDPDRCVQIGIRGAAEFLWEFSYVSGMTVIHAEEVLAGGLQRTIDRMLEVVGDGPTYVTFDVDGLDPVFAPGTGTPEVGGLQTREAAEIIRAAAGCNLIGGDVVEVAPQYDTTTNTAQTGAQMLFEIFSVLAISNDNG
jgi:agmatinase